MLVFFLNSSVAQGEDGWQPPAATEPGEDTHPGWLGWEQELGYFSIFFLLNPSGGFRGKSRYKVSTS